MERKYRQRGYSDRDAAEKKRERAERRDHPGEPRPKQDMLGPRTPRMVGTVTRARCSSCGAVLAPSFDPNGECPRCHFALHRANSAFISIPEDSSNARSRFRSESRRKMRRTIARSSRCA